MNPMQMMPPQMAQFFNMMKGFKNPQQFAMNLLQQNSSDPMMQNLLSMAQKNDAKGIEQVVRNAAKEKGIDFDQSFSGFKQFLKTFI